MKTATKEIRQSDSAPLTVNGSTVRGLAIVYNSPSQPLSDWLEGDFVEYVRPGAFRSAFGKDILALWGHVEAVRPPLGRTSSGTLQLEDTPEGVRFVLDLPTSAGDILEAVNRRDVKGVSWGAYVIKDRWTQVKDEVLVREILEAELVEISLVNRPAYEATSVTRSASPPIERERAIARLAEIAKTLKPITSTKPKR